MGLKEFEEAEYCAFLGLEKNPDNYELWLLLAELYSVWEKGNSIKIARCCSNAIKYSNHTKDAKEVAYLCKSLLSSVV